MVTFQWFQGLPPLSLITRLSNSLKKQSLDLDLVISVVTCVNLVKLRINVDAK